MDFSGVTTRALEQLGRGKHALKIEAELLKTRAEVELEYSIKLRGWARSLRGQVDTNSVGEVREVETALRLLADEADLEANKHKKVHSDIYMNINGPHHRLVRFREMNYHKGDTGRGCREINFYQREFKKLHKEYHEVFEKYVKWKNKLDDAKKSPKGSHPWFLRPDYTLIETHRAHVMTKFNIHSNREKDERHTVIQNTCRLLDEMREFEKRRVRLLVDQMKSYLKILRHNHEESFRRGQILAHTDSHLEEMMQNSNIIEDWSKRIRRADRRGKGDTHEVEIVPIAGTSSHQLVEEDSEKPSEDSSLNGGCPVKPSEEGTKLNREESPPDDICACIFQLSDSEDDNLNGDGTRRRLKKQHSASLITHTDIGADNNKGFQTIISDSESQEVILLAPENREEARTQAWVMRQSTNVAWSVPKEGVGVRQTKSNKEHNPTERLKSAGMSSAAELRQEGADATPERAGKKSRRARINQVSPTSDATRLLSPSMTMSPKRTISTEIYRARTPTEISFGKGRTVTMMRGPDDGGMAYGYKTTTSGKKKFGYFPYCVVRV